MVVIPILYANENASGNRGVFVGVDVGYSATPAVKSRHAPRSPGGAKRTAPNSAGNMEIPPWQQQIPQADFLVKPYTIVDN
jgi:hypothetical protein